MQETPNSQYIPSWAAIPGLIIGALSLASLFTVNLDLGPAFEKFIIYYRQLRDWLFFPLSLLGVDLPKTIKDLFIIASVALGTAIRTKKQDAEFIATCFLGSLVLSFPSLGAFWVAAISMAALKL